MADADTAVVDVVVEHSWPVTIKLAYPVELGSQTIESLTFRRGRLADIKGLKIDGVPPVDQIVLVASRMCGQTTGVIERLDADDAGTVIEIVLGFFARCLGAGKMP